MTARLQGGRSPAERSRFVTWNDPGGAPATPPLGAPWPGQIPPPAPAIVHPAPLPAELADADGTPVAVSGRGLLTAAPDRLSVERRPVVGGDRLGRAVAGRRAVVVDGPAGGAPACRRSPARRPTCSWSNGAGGGSRPPTADRTPPPTMPYAELHAHSNFSFLDGASHPEELAAEAARLGLSALALTDHNGLYGVVRFAEAARAFGLPTVFGAELTLTGVDGPRRPAPACPTRTAPTWSCWPGTPRATPASAGPSPRPTWPAGRRGSRSSPSTRWPTATAATGRSSPGAARGPSPPPSPPRARRPRPGRSTT